MFLMSRRIPPTFRQGLSLPAKALRLGDPSKTFNDKARNHRQFNDGDFGFFVCFIVPNGYEEVMSKA